MTNLNNILARIISFLGRATLPIVSILDQRNATDFKSADETVVIAYIPEEEKTLRSAFTELAFRHHDKYTFGIVSDMHLAQAENIQLPSVVVHNSKEGEQEVLPGPSGIDALEKFLEQATAPSIGEFTRRNELKYMKVLFPSISKRNFADRGKPRLENPSSTTSRTPKTIAKHTGNL
jgi:protein disulfide-isomerase A1